MNVTPEMCLSRLCWVTPDTWDAYTPEEQEFLHRMDSLKAAYKSGKEDALPTGADVARLYAMHNKYHLAGRRYRQMLQDLHEGMAPGYWSGVTTMEAGVLHRMDTESREKPDWVPTHDEVRVLKQVHARFYPTPGDPDAQSQDPRGDQGTRAEGRAEEVSSPAVHRQWEG